MALKLKLNKAEWEGLEEGFQKLYEEKDGGYVLSVDGVEDTSALRSALQKERADREKFSKQVKAWEALGKTPEEISELLAKLDADEAKLAEIAEARWKAETGGMAVDGLIIKTDRESQSMIGDAAFTATLDPNYICQWKTSSGFMTLDAATVLTVAQAVRAHVQGCFDREAELSAVVEAAGTVEEVEAVCW